MGHPQRLIRRKSLMIENPQPPCITTTPLPPDLEYTWIPATNSLGVHFPFPNAVVTQNPAPNTKVDYYIHNDSDGVRISVDVEKNTKGYNWGVKVSGAKTVEEAIKELRKAQAELEKYYGPNVIS
jgi:hypothetical protein